MKCLITRAKFEAILHYFHQNNLAKRGVVVRSTAQCLSNPKLQNGTNDSLMAAHNIFLLKEEMKYRSNHDYMSLGPWGS